MIEFELIFPKVGVKHFRACTSVHGNANYRVEVCDKIEEPLDG